MKTESRPACKSFRFGPYTYNIKYPLLTSPIKPF